MPRRIPGCRSFSRSGVSRREMLRAGAVGALGLGLPDLLAADEGRRGKGIVTRADRCIIIFLNGGPSHLDMWDMMIAGKYEEAQAKWDAVKCHRTQQGTFTMMSRIPKDKAKLFMSRELFAWALPETPPDEILTDLFDGI